MGRLTEASKYLPPQARIALIKRLEAMVGEHLDHGLMLTPDMVINLDRAGIEIGAHTISHPILTSLDDASSRLEIEGGKRELEAIIGKPVRLFAYPNGKVGKDFDQRHTAMAREAFFAAAFTTRSRAISGGTDLYQLPRSRPWDRSPFMFGLRLLRWLAWDERPGNDYQHDDAHTHAPDGTRIMNTRVLLTAFHFPPQAASSGIQRTLSFSRHLGSHGWDPMVLSANPRAYSVQNPSQLASVPPNLVVRRASPSTASATSASRAAIRKRWPCPTAGYRGGSAAWLSGLSMIRKYKPQVLWSTFPIATSHLIALALHRISGLPWVADFRDPMLQSSYPVSRMQRAVYAWIERQTIERCTAAVFTTHSARDSYVARFPGAARVQVFGDRERLR
ncbi:polysaccharide deacetylase family protein [Massilia sp. B-10]|nr:polysaccharide deacetylase family protein [Massilia sp. B-10]